MSTRAVTPTAAAPEPALTPQQRPLLQRTCECGQHTGGAECNDCRNKKKNALQRTAGGSAPLLAPHIVHDVLRTPGRALDDGAQSYFAAQFGYDFSQVRVHADEQASESAHTVGAHAYTVGRHLVFANGRYAPHTADGRSLLSHELTHVMQQSAAPYVGGDLEIGGLQDSAEREAARSEKIVPGEHVRAHAIGAPRVQGKWDWERAGKGALIGAGIGGTVLGVAALAGASGLGWFALGALGAAIGGFFIGGFTGREEKRQQTEQPPPPGCSTDTAGRIRSGVGHGITMVQKTLALLNAFKPKASGDAESDKAAGLLREYFKSDDPKIASYVRDRFRQILDMMSRLQMGLQSPQPKPGQDQKAPAPSISCHTQQNDDTCKRAAAYVGEVTSPDAPRDSMVFCSDVLNGGDFNTEDARGHLVIHEVAHAILSGKRYIGDRAYYKNRFFKQLTTAEALSNADSYAAAAEHVSWGSAPSGGPWMDDIKGCDDAQQDVLNNALGMAQRWIGVAVTVSHDCRPEWLALEYWINLRKKYLGGEALDLIQEAAKVYDKVSGWLGFMVSASCHPDPDPACPPGRPTNISSGTLGPEIQLCPQWIGEKDPEKQALLILTEMLKNSGATEAQAGQYAELARELGKFLNQAPPLEELLGPQPPPAPQSAAAPKPKGEPCSWPDASKTPDSPAKPSSGKKKGGKP